MDNISKRSQIQFENNHLKIELNSIYGSKHHPPENQKELYDKIVELRKQLKDINNVK